MPDPYRVAVIGHTGRGNYGHGLDAVWNDLPNCQLVGVADPDPVGLAAAIQRLRAPNGFADYRQMLDKTRPHVVAICPRWVDQHLEMVLAAAERGIHIYMEKPLCRTLAEADRMAAACEKSNIKLAVAHQTRYSPKLHVVRDMIYDDRIGKVLELRGRGKEDQRGGGEDLWVLGSHIMNLMAHFGGEPRWCFASVQDQGKPITKASVVEGNEGFGPLAGDAVAAMYGMDEGITAYFATQRNRSVGNNSRFGLQILGSKGIIEILTGHLPAVHYLADPAWSPGRSGARWIPVSSAGPGKPEPLPDDDTANRNILACQDLLESIEQDRLPECNIYEARLTVEMIAAVFESQRVGGPVTFPLATRQNPLTLIA